MFKILCFSDVFSFLSIKDLVDDDVTKLLFSKFDVCFQMIEFIFKGHVHTFKRLAIINIIIYIFSFKHNTRFISDLLKSILHNFAFTRTLSAMNVNQSQN